MSKPASPAHALAFALLEALPPDVVAELRHALQHGTTLAGHLRDVTSLVPLLTPDGTRIRPDIKPLLSTALTELACTNDLREQVRSLCRSGRTEQAINTILRYGGVFLCFTRGLTEARSIADVFPDDDRKSRLELILLDAMNALKAGNPQLADLTLGQIAKLPQPEEIGEHTDILLGCFVFVRAVYTDQPISDLALTQLSALVSRLPREDSLILAIMHNVVLDICMRRGDMVVAEDAAERSWRRYEAAGAPGHAFYINLYLIVIALNRGDSDKAGQAASLAREALGRLTGASDNDALLLDWFELILLYERGDPAPLVDYLLGDGGRVPTGELWPAMAEPLLNYSRRALAAEVSPGAALAWVRSWWGRQWYSQQFTELISGHEAAALQQLGRWQEADEVLAPLESPSLPIVRITKLASALDRGQGLPALALALDDELARPDQILRHRLNLLLLACETALKQAFVQQTISGLETMIRTAPPERLPMFWREKGARLARLLRSSDLRAEIRKRPRLRRVLADLTQSKTDVSQPKELTQQEYRVLLLLAESLPNKAIANRIGVTLPTVKFHVSNLFAKTGMRSRRDVVKRAAELRWLPE